MTTKYTPGPWEYNWNATRWVIDSAPAHAIACTAGYEPENKANARLIAAAPEFADAARKALAGNPLMDGGEFIAISREAYDAFRALLARIDE